MAGSKIKLVKHCGKDLKKEKVEGKDYCFPQMPIVKVSRCWVKYKSSQWILTFPHLKNQKVAKNLSN